MSDRRTQLLSATCAVIARHGVRGLRVDEVAREAGASTALIYYYFRDRSGLLSNVLAFVNERSGEFVRHREQATGRENLIAQLTDEFQDLDAVRANSAVWGELRSAAVFDADLQPQIARATQVWNDALVSAITAGQRDGSIPFAVDASDAAVRLSCLVEGLGNRWLSQQISTERARALVSTAVARELSCDPAARLASTRHERR